MTTRTQPSAAELVGRVLSGETEVFAELVRRHQRDVYGVLVSLLRDRAATENLVQQTFINAFERLHQFRRDADFLLWVKGIARNLAYDDLRRSSAETARLGVYREHLLAQAGDEEAADQHESRMDRALDQCLGELAPAATRALQLRYQEALGVEAVAHALGRTVNATYQLLFRARVAIQKCIDARLAGSR